ncbi:hypothetical protein RND81_10G169500 [Saponaria officinalis]|uniref:PPM-type phosphatase domain-containing protein n=1 Tax=Saponaria officinalis TaxID=3572 RepID=A0AAW1I2P9_SAPOF
MGNKGSTSSDSKHGVGSVLHDQEGHRVVSCLHSRRGGKWVNQDSAVVYQGYGAIDGVFCGVFDGHGKNGHLVSRLVKKRLALLLLDQKQALMETNLAPNDTSGGAIEDDLSSNTTFSDWKTACLIAFTEMDEEIRVNKKFDASLSGSTAVVVLKQGDDLIIANLGDSRAILGTKDGNRVAAVQLTTDLKPGTPDEADRIRRSNGRVFALREEPGHERAWLPGARSPGMAMSRSFGDLVMKNHGIISTPVVTHRRITSDDLFVVLASDGIWDVLSNREVASIVWAAENEETAAKAVVDEAIMAWRIKVPYDKADDCTAVCLFLQNKGHTRDEATTS